MYLDFLFSYSIYLDPLRCVIVATLKRLSLLTRVLWCFVNLSLYSWQTRFPSLISVWKLALRLLKFSAEYIKFIIISEKARELIFFQRNIWLAGTNHVVRLNRSNRGFRGSDSVLSLEFVAINNGKFPLKICVKYATSNIILAIIRKIRVSTFTSRSLDDVLVF